MAKKKQKSYTSICLVCNSIIKPNKKQCDSEKRKVIFNAFCSFLNLETSVKINPAKHWQFDKEILPFCSSCLIPILELDSLYKQLESVYAKAFDIIENIIVQISETVENSQSTGIRTNEKKTKQSKASIANQQRLHLFRKEIIAQLLDTDTADNVSKDSSDETGLPGDSSTQNDSNLETSTLSQHKTVAEKCHEEIECSFAGNKKISFAMEEQASSLHQSVNLENDHPCSNQETKITDDNNVEVKSEISSPWPSPLPDAGTDWELNAGKNADDTSVDSVVYSPCNNMEKQDEGNESFSSMDVDIDYAPNSDSEGESVDDDDESLHQLLKSNNGKNPQILERIKPKDTGQNKNAVPNRSARRNNKNLSEFKFKPLSMLQTAPKKKTVFHYLNPDGTIYFDGVKILTGQDGFKCDLCEKVFKHRSSIYNHIAMIHTDGKNCCTCDVCGKKFRTPSQVEKHKQGHGKPKSYLIDNIRCKLCDLRFRIPSDLVVHMQTVHQHEDTSDIPETLIKPESNYTLKRKPRFTVEKNEDGKLYCEGIEVLLTNNGKYRCSLCEDVVFKLQHSVARHIGATHLDLPHEHSCPVCQKKFKGAYEVKLHVQIHENRKSHKCPVCDRGFNLKQGMYGHLKMHSKEEIHKAKEKKFGKNYASHTYSRNTLDSQNGKDIFRGVEILALEEGGFHCGQCTDSYLYKFRHSVTTHILRRHVDKSDWYPCDECGRLFLTVGEVKMHKQIHENKRSHKCDVCGKGFNLRSSLVIHKKFHPEEREKQKYICPICNIKFVSRLAQENHTRTHTGEKPFACPHPLCDRTFTSKAVQVFHTKKVHAEDFEENT